MACLISVVPLVRGQDAGQMTAAELLAAGDAALATGEWEKVRLYFGGFLEGYRDEPELKDAVAKVIPYHAVALLRLKQYAEAAAPVEEALALPTLDPVLGEELRFWKGLLLLQQEDYDASITALAAYYQTPAHPVVRKQEALLLHGVCLVMKEDWAAADAFYAERLPALRTLNREAAGRGAVLHLHALMQAEAWDQALTLVREMYPRQSEITQITAWQTMCLQLGTMLMEQDRYYDAILCLQRIWNRDRLLKHQAERQSWLEQQLAQVRGRKGSEALIFQWEGMKAKVARESEQFAKVEHWDAALRFRLAECYRRLGRWRECALILGKMTSELPASDITKQASLSVIQCWMRVKRWSAAEKAADEFVVKFGAGDPAGAALARFLKAQSAYDDKRYADAVAFFAKVLELHPQHDLAPKAQLMQGLALMMQDENEAARAVFESLPKTYPKSVEVEDADYWTGMALCFDNDYPASKEHMAGYLERYDKPRYKAEALFRIAYCDHAEGDYETAIPALASWVGEFDGLEFTNEARILLGDAHLAIGDFNEGLAAYESVTEDDERFYEEARFKMGNAWKVADDKEKMRETFNTFVEKRPMSRRLPEAIYWLGWIEQKEGNDDKARTFYLDYMAKYGNDPLARGVEDLFEALPKVYGKEVSEWDAALETMAAEAGAKVETTREVRALWAAAKRREAQSISAFTLWEQLAERIDVKIHDPRIIADTADGLREKNLLLESAVRLYTELRKWHPNSLERERAWLGLGLIAKYQGKSEEALNWLELYEAKNVSGAFNAGVKMAKAELLAKAKRYQEAAESLDALLENAASTSETKAAALLLHGDLLMDRKEYKKATAYLERVYVSYGKYKELVASAYVKRAFCLEKLGRNEGAVETLLDMLQRPDMADLKETREARRTLDRLDPDWELLFNERKASLEEAKRQASDGPVGNPDSTEEPAP